MLMVPVPPPEPLLEPPPELLPELGPPPEALLEPLPELLELPLPEPLLAPSALLELPLPEPLLAPPELLAPLLLDSAPELPLEPPLEPLPEPDPSAEPPPEPPPASPTLPVPEPPSGLPGPELRPPQPEEAGSAATRADANRTCWIDRDMEGPSNGAVTLPGGMSQGSPARGGISKSWRGLPANPWIPLGKLDSVVDMLADEIARRRRHRCTFIDRRFECRAHRFVELVIPARTDRRSIHSPYSPQR